MAHMIMISVRKEANEVIPYDCPSSLPGEGVQRKSERLPEFRWLSLETEEAKKARIQSAEDDHHTQSTLGVQRIPLSLQLNVNQHKHVRRTPRLGEKNNQKGADGIIFGNRVRIVHSTTMPNLIIQGHQVKYSKRYQLSSQG